MLQGGYNLFWGIEEGLCWNCQAPACVWEWFALLCTSQPAKTLVRLLKVLPQL